MDCQTGKGPPPCIWTFVASVVCWCTYSIFNDSLIYIYKVISGALFIIAMSLMHQSQVHVPLFCICTVSLSPHSVLINVGYGGYGLVVNVHGDAQSFHCMQEARMPKDN